MYKCRNLKSKCRVSLDGDITIYQAAALNDSLAAILDDQRPLEIDLSGVAEIDSAGIQLLMMLKRECARRGRPFALVHHSPAVLDTFELAGLFDYFGDPVLLAGTQGVSHES